MGVKELSKLLVYHTKKSGISYNSSQNGAKRDEVAEKCFASIMDSPFTATQNILHTTIALIHFN